MKESTKWRSRWMTDAVAVDLLAMRRTSRGGGLTVDARIYDASGRSKKVSGGLGALVASENSKRTDEARDHYTEIVGIEWDLQRVMVQVDWFGAEVERHELFIGESIFFGDKTSRVSKTCWKLELIKARGQQAQAEQAGRELIKQAVDEISMVNWF